MKNFKIEVEYFDETKKCVISRIKPETEKMEQVDENTYNIRPNHTSEDISNAVSNFIKNNIIFHDIKSSKLTYEEALETGETFIISPGCKSENRGIFSNFRVDRNTIPEGSYLYEIRGEGENPFCTIEEQVFVNFTGSFLTDKPIKFTRYFGEEENKRYYKYLSGRYGYTFE